MARDLHGIQVSTRRRAALVGLFGVGVLVACGDGPASREAASAVQPNEVGPSGPALGARLLTPGPTAGPSGLTVVLPNSDLAAGASRRFLLGLLGPDSRPLPNLEPPVRFFKLQGERAQLRAEGTARWFTSPALSGRGVYVTRVDLPEPGQWGVEVQVRAAGGVQSARASFEVKAQSATPDFGAPVPASQTLVGTTPAEIEKFCSARPVDDLHRLSVADALTQQRPLAILFSTPAFCTSQTCGPALGDMQALAEIHSQRGNFIHVEIYEGAQPPNVVPAVREWGLPSEPWLFLVDAAGKVVEKFEGMITRAEVEPFVARLMNE